MNNDNRTTDMDGVRNFAAPTFERALVAQVEAQSGSPEAYSKVTHIINNSQSYRIAVHHEEDVAVMAATLIDYGLDFAIQKIHLQDSRVEEPTDVPTYWNIIVWHEAIPTCRRMNWRVTA